VTTNLRCVTSQESKILLGLLDPKFHSNLVGKLEDKRSFERARRRQRSILTCIAKKIGFGGAELYSAVPTGGALTMAVNRNNRLLHCD
jgi:hypothetical protein